MKNFHFYRQRLPVTSADGKNNKQLSRAKKRFPFLRHCQQTLHSLKEVPEELRMAADTGTSANAGSQVTATEVKFHTYPFYWPSLLVNTP
ncbi:hypothetical protein [Enterobacter ludwigii]|jgi:hypothetical protein